MSESEPSFACLLGAGYSRAAGVPLAKDLLNARYVLALSQASARRFERVHAHFREWQQTHPFSHAEEYLGGLFDGSLGVDSLPWSWAVEFISAVIASVGTPPASLNRNPRYSNRLNRPTGCRIHRLFWDTILKHAQNLAVVTTNYDILIERALRHRAMHRPPSPGCFYGGFPRPQVLRGAAQPFSAWSPEKLIEMTGRVPVFKLHGSLNWSLEGGKLMMYQDARAAFRNGGNAAIVAPVPEKSVPTWLTDVWNDSKVALANSDVWIVCGYSAPVYDTEVIKLLKEGAQAKCRHIFLLSPDSNSLQERWADIAPGVTVTALAGLPDGIDALDKELTKIYAATSRR